MLKKNRTNRETMQHSDQLTYAGTSALENNDVLKNYNLDIVRRLAKSLAWFPNRSTLRILDFGAGIGTIAKLWKSQINIEPEVCELDPSQRSRLLELGFTRISSTIRGVESEYDIVYSSNVLEHIEDDSAALRDLFVSLKPGGCLALYVPAMPALFSELDRKVGHYRRYTRRGLRQEISEAGFRLVKIEYCDSIGVPASIALKVFGFDSKKGLGGTGSLIFYDRMLYPASRLLDSLGLKYFFGKNLFVLARKPDAE